MPNAKKLNPKQTFVLCQWSRKRIAAELNTAIEVIGSDVKRFTSDDPRLTDKVCQGYVDAVYEAISDDSSDAEHQVTIDALDQFA